MTKNRSYYKGDEKTRKTNFEQFQELPEDLDHVTGDACV